MLLLFYPQKSHRPSSEVYTDDRLQRYEETSTIQNKMRSFCDYCRAKYTILGYYVYKREKFKEFFGRLVNCLYLCHKIRRIITNHTLNAKTNYRLKMLGSLP